MSTRFSEKLEWNKTQLDFEPIIGKAFLAQFSKGNDITL